MAILYDSATEQQRSASAATTTFTHVADTGVRGVLVGFVRAVTTTDNITAVSYGGTNLVRVNRATDTANEPGEASWWFAPHTTAGSQTVAYNTGVTGSNIHAVAITIKADATPYVIGARSVSENTSSFSTNITTGYAGGMAFDALYWGGASPSDVTIGASQSLVHDWDMGNFGSKFTRHTNAIAKGTGPTTPYTLSSGGDDVAWVVAFITDGVNPVGSPQAAAGTPLKVEGRAPTIKPFLARTVAPGVGSVSTQGLIPVISTFQPVEESRTPGVGSVTLSGRQAALGRQRTITPSLPTCDGPNWFLRETNSAPTWATREATGGITVQGKTPTARREWTSRSGLGAIATAGRAPTLITARLITPDVGAVTLDGLIPTVATSQTVEATTSPGVGTVTLDGRQAALYTERTIETDRPVTPTVVGRQPALTTARTITPDAGTISLDGRAATLGRERVILPGAGTLATAGRAPATVPEGTVAPGQNTLTLAGLAPSLLTDRIVLPGVGSISAEGRQPTVSTEIEIEATVTPAQAALTLDGRAPAELRDRTISPALGAAQTAGQAPSLAKDALATAGTGSVSVSGLAPALRTTATVAPAAATISLNGRLPAISTAILGVSPATLQLIAEGRAPSLLTERAVSPDLAALSISGGIPTYGVEGQQTVEPNRATVALGALAPTLATERIVAPGVGAVALAGRVPALEVFAPVELTITPDVGALTINELASVVSTASELGGSPITRRRRGRIRARGIPEPVETSAGPVSAPPELRPEPPAHFTVPLSALGGIDTSDIAARLTALESAAVRRARQRREEEELISFLMKVA